MAWGKSRGNGRRSVAACSAVGNQTLPLRRWGQAVDVVERTLRFHELRQLAMQRYAIAQVELLDRRPRQGRRQGNEIEPSLGLIGGNLLRSQQVGDNRLARPQHPDLVAIVLDRLAQFEFSRLTRHRRLRVVQGIESEYSRKDLCGVQLSSRHFRLDGTWRWAQGQFTWVVFLSRSRQRFNKTQLDGDLRVFRHKYPMTPISIKEYVLILSPIPTTAFALLVFAIPSLQSASAELLSNFFKTTCSIGILTFWCRVRHPIPELGVIQAFNYAVFLIISVYVWLWILLGRYARPANYRPGSAPITYQVMWTLWWIFMAMGGQTFPQMD